MGNQFASDKRALGICDRCGQTYGLKEFKQETVKGRLVNTKVCPECFDPDHPQLHLGTLPVYDPQALRNPRTDQAELEASREMSSPTYQELLDAGLFP